MNRPNNGEAPAKGATPETVPTTAAQKDTAADAEILARVARRANFEYAIRYSRLGWRHRQVRIFKSPQPAARFAERLRRQTDASLAPITELWVERRQLGPVELFKVWL